MTDLPVIDDPFDGPAGGAEPARLPGQFRRNHQGAPWVAHPTDTVKPRGNKADLIATCQRLGLVDPGGRELDTLKNDELRDLIGSEPKWVLYGRPSSFGKELDNDFNLQRWKERHLVRGLALDPSFTSRVDLSEDGVVDGMVARAYDAAQTSLAADRGSHIHLLTEIADNTDADNDWIAVTPDGEELGIPYALQERIVDQWFEFRSRLGIEAVRIEQPIVNDDLQVAGTFDRLDRFTRGLDTTLGSIGTGQCAIGDIKTGNPHRTTYPLQLVAYRDGQPYDPDTDTRHDWPDDAAPHPGIALIYHYDLARAIDGEPVDWQIVPVDLTIARRGAELVAAARRYAKRDDVFAPTIPAGGGALPEPAACDTVPSPAAPTTGEPCSTSATEADSTAFPTASSTSTQSPTSRSPGELDTETPEPTSSPTSSSHSTSTKNSSTETRRQQLRDRYRHLTDADQRRFADLNINPDDLDAIEAGLNQIDPFAHTIDPTPRQRPTAEPRPVGVDEGEPASETELADVRAAWGLLEPDQAAWVKSVVGQVGNLSIEQNPSQRRVAIGFALVQLAAAGWHDVELLRACMTDARVDDLSTCGVGGAADLAFTVQAVVNEDLKFTTPKEGGPLQLTAA